LLFGHTSTNETEVALNVAHLVLPAQTRQWLRRTYDAWRFDAAMRRFIADPEAAIEPDSGVLAELIAAWGNTGWSAQDEYLRQCITHALAASGPTLECGSGLSTLLLGVAAARRGHQHFALEHMPAWGDKVSAAALRHRIHAVLVCDAPLKSYAGFVWYDVSALSLPPAFSMVVCDGPPADTPGGRYGLVPVMRESLPTGCVILLDDAEREHERTIARRWQAELGATHEVIGHHKPFIRMVVEPSGTMAQWRKAG
jgi:hypothetical protein